VEVVLGIQSGNERIREEVLGRKRNLSHFGIPKAIKVLLLLVIIPYGFFVIAVRKIVRRIV